MGVMKTFLSIPQTAYESVRNGLDSALGLSGIGFDTSIIPNKKPAQDGNIYVAVPAEWPTDLTAQYAVDEATWRAASTKTKPAVA
jgi:hypothetical protein